MYGTLQLRRRHGQLAREAFIVLLIRLLLRFAHGLRCSGTIAVPLA
jgi:hypothetical protein